MMNFLQNKMIRHRYPTLEGVFQQVSIFNSGPFLEVWIEVIVSQ